MRSAIVVAAVVLVGCVASPFGNSDITDAMSNLTVIDCDFLGEVQGFSGLGSAHWAVDDARDQARQLGADTIYWREAHQGLTAVIFGEAYRCREASAGATPTS